jgi:hypothetical protein
VIHALLNQGWAVAASAMHGDNWGNANGVTDLTDLISTINTNYLPVGKVGLIGTSMGGLAASIVTAAGSIANLKGVYAIDAVFNLPWAYEQSGFRAAITTAHGITAGTLSGATTVGATSLPTTASFPNVGTQLTVGAGTANTEVVTTTGASTGAAVAVTATTKAHASGDVVSDFPTKTAGRNPLGLSAAALKAASWRFLAVNTGGFGTLDTQVSPDQNTDLMTAYVAGAPESGVLRHGTGHLSLYAAQPADAVGFFQRAFAR